MAKRGRVSFASSDYPVVPLEQINVRLLIGLAKPVMSLYL